MSTLQKSHQISLLWNLDVPSLFNTHLHLWSSSFKSSISPFWVDSSTQKPSPSSSGLIVAVHVLLLDSYLSTVLLRKLRWWRTSYTLTYLIAILQVPSPVGTFTEWPLNLSRFSIDLPVKSFALLLLQVLFPPFPTIWIQFLISSLINSNLFLSFQ